MDDSLDEREPGGIIHSGSVQDAEGAAGFFVGIRDRGAAIGIVYVFVGGEAIVPEGLAVVVAVD